jgi:plasmid stability protein
MMMVRRAGMQVTIDQLEPEVVETLRRRAEAAGRSLEQELREIVKGAAKEAEALAKEQRRRRIEAWKDRSRALRQKLWGDQISGDSTEIIRKMRDERYGSDDPRWQD